MTILHEGDPINKGFCGTAPPPMDDEEWAALLDEEPGISNETQNSTHAREQPAPPKPKFTAQKASDIVKKDLNWLWYPFFPQGTLCSIVGAQSAGKTYLMLKMAADIANGVELPQENLHPNYLPFKDPRNVMLFMSEDDPSRTIKKRLDELVTEEEQENIYIIGVGEEHIAMTDPEVEKAIAELKPALVVFDPVQAYMPTGTDMNNQVDVRAVLSHMIALAEKYNVTILYTQHMNKQTTQSALYRANGSNELTAAPRASVLLGKDPENENRRVMAVTKANLVRLEHQKSIVFEIDTRLTPSIQWRGVTDLQADDIASVRRSKNGEPTAEEEYRKAPKRSEAAVFLEELLENNDGHCLFSEIEKQGKAQKISRSALYRAKDNMKEFIKNTQKGGNKPVYWYFEGHEPPEQFEIGE